MFHRPRRGLLLDRRLGKDALYRVVDVRGEVVEVEVVRAPGLESGTHVRFTQNAVSHMTVVEEDAATAAPERDLRAIDGRRR